MPTSRKRPPRPQLLASRERATKHVTLVHLLGNKEFLHLQLRIRHELWVVMVGKKRVAQGQAWLEG
jgi:hypothetical protein